MQPKDLLISYNSYIYIYTYHIVSHIDFLWWYLLTALRRRSSCEFHWGLRGPRLCPKTHALLERIRRIRKMNKQVTKLTCLCLTRWQDQEVLQQLLQLSCEACASDLSPSMNPINKMYQRCRASLVPVCLSDISFSPSLFVFIYCLNSSLLLPCPSPPDLLFLPLASQISTLLYDPLQPCFVALTSQI